MRVYVVEGTPEEIREAIPGLATAVEGQITTVPTAAPTAVSRTAVEAEEGEEEDEEQAYVSVDVAREVLTRRKLHDSQKKMLRAIYKAHPGQISAIDLQALLSQNTAQFRGFMGAWGRRYSHTEGFVEGEWFFDQDWDDEQACYLYGLPESVREAMKLEKLV
jgi:hypothetical protein